MTINKQLEDSLFERRANSRRVCSATFLLAALTCLFARLSMKSWFAGIRIERLIDWQLIDWKHKNEIDSCQCQFSCTSLARHTKELQVSSPRVCQTVKLNINAKHSFVFWILLFQVQAFREAIFHELDLLCIASKQCKQNKRRPMRNLLARETEFGRSQACRNNASLVCKKRASVNRRATQLRAIVDATDLLFKFCLLQQSFSNVVRKCVARELELRDASQATKNSKSTKSGSFRVAPLAMQYKAILRRRAIDKARRIGLNWIAPIIATSCATATASLTLTFWRALDSVFVARPTLNNSLWVNLAGN